MLFYSNFILIVAILLLLNIWIFDRSRNASIGFRTKSIIGIIIAAIITQLFLVFGEKKRSKK
ncbi:TPA: hypothetical protein IX196_000188 [Enterococcus faecium]|uniref:hypothetical protein n=1 Tax=Enterococcus faecium TaxID=1352 RepID=UPI0029717747|nr:hypothetical protein [Enterococcus faecium]